jgi:hypothetical protein
MNCTGWYTLGMIAFELYAEESLHDRSLVQALVRVCAPA